LHYVATAIARIEPGAIPKALVNGYFHNPAASDAAHASGR
jgi:hypothetical protein